MNESLQIDFLAVISGEKSGDAIAFRYGDFSERKLYKVVVIDGGTLQSGADLVEHLKTHYETNHVDLVICTHPDADHASGLRQVIRNCTVGELWMHLPWKHSAYISHLFHDGRITDNSLSQRLKDEYNYIHELEQIANNNGIKIREPFAGKEFDNGKIQVLGPETSYYRELVPHFARSPEINENTFVKAFTTLTEKAVAWIDETFDIETLDNSGKTSSENLSSSVVLLNLNGEKYLFTGDAGIESMEKVINYCKINNIDISNIKFFQVPHHGSRRNISPAILNAIKCKGAYISASKESEKHPSKKVINALIRRGAEVFSTEGTGFCHKMNSKSREGWSSAKSHPFYDQVEI